MESQPCKIEPRTLKGVDMTERQDGSQDGHQDVGVTNEPDMSTQNDNRPFTDWGSGQIFTGGANDPKDKRARGRPNGR
jgi:hypothetical protein